MSDSFHEHAAANPDEAAEIAVNVAEALNEIVAMFGPDAIDWIRAELIRSAVRSFTDRNGDTWIQHVDGALSMVDAPDPMFYDRAFDEVGFLYGPLTQMSGVPVPLVHATSPWKRPLGWLGIRTRALCGERIVAGKVSGPTQKCRECQRAVDGEQR